MKKNFTCARLKAVSAGALIQWACMAHAADIDPDAQARKTVSAMTMDEKLRIVFGYFPGEVKGKRPEAGGVAMSAGFVPGVERLDIPYQQQTDAGIGVASQIGAIPRARTALPSGIATAATWNPELAYAGGAMIGREARLSGNNVMLAGGINLLREPRNGRNFEYAGEDPLLAGVMVGEQIRGIQSNHLIATIKHFAINSQETGRMQLSAKIGDSAARMSDLLAFQIAIERGQPGAVMCAYNRVNGDYACENDYLLNQVLKRDWGFKGYVMSDWGGAHSTMPAAMRGLDQQSGWPFDQSPYFKDALKEAVQNGHVSAARLDDMAQRILRSMYASGLMRHPVKIEGDAIDFAAHGMVSQEDAEQSLVLLKNKDGLLPLSGKDKRIAIIGGMADVGVLSGGGSSQVYPVGGAIKTDEGYYFPSSPMQALAKRSKARFIYHDGKDVAAAKALAASSDLVIVFATQYTSETWDRRDMSLPNRQDALIAAAGAANPRTVVVLETGSPVTMPWLDQVGAVVEAWYPGTSGGEAIARVLTGEVDASGRLPATFPASVTQLPRPALDGVELPYEARFEVDYDIEGAAVGYKWFDKHRLKPLFAFGHGLSYTSFRYTGLKAAVRDDVVEVGFEVTNSGQRDGKAVPQVYVAHDGAGWEAPKRLAGWQKLSVARGQARSATVSIDPRTLAVFDAKARKWKVLGGTYTFILSEAADTPIASVKVEIAAREFAPGARR